MNITILIKNNKKIFLVKGLLWIFYVITGLTLNSLFFFQSLIDILQNHSKSLIVYYFSFITIINLG